MRKEYDFSKGERGKFYSKVDTRNPIIITQSQMSKNKISHKNNWKINIQQACKNRGIENAFQLWQKIGGSKATSADLWNGKSKMISMKTLDRLDNLVGIKPFEILFNSTENE